MGRVPRIVTPMVEPSSLRLRSTSVNPGGGMSRTSTPGRRVLVVFSSVIVSET